MLNYIKNLLSDFRRFFDTGYFPCAFGLILVYVFLPLVSLGLSHILFLFHFTSKRFSTYRFDFLYTLCIARFNCKCRILICQNLKNYEVKILSFWVKKLVALVICKFKLTLTG